ncbi:MAG: hypothetical protein ACJ8AW_02775 [Rhodopila sp.]
MRHAVDADHIVAIDTVPRKLMQESRRPNDNRHLRWAFLKSITLP